MINIAQTDRSLGASFTPMKPAYGTTLAPKGTRGAASPKIRKLSRIRCRWVDKLSKKSGKIWSEWQDLNLRPPAPEAGALPGCATLRPAEAHVYRRDPTEPQEKA